MWQVRQASGFFASALLNLWRVWQELQGEPYCPSARDFSSRIPTLWQPPHPFIPWM